MGIDHPGAIARREFMLGAGASLLAACDVMRQVQNTETLSSAPRTDALQPVLAALITSVLPFEHPQFPALTVRELEQTLLEMFPIESDAELAEVRSAMMLFDACASYDSPPAPFREAERERLRASGSAGTAAALAQEEARMLAHDRAAFAAYAAEFGMTRFADQSLAARRVYLALWSRSALQIRRRIFRGFRAWVLISAYARPELWRVIGYDGPRLARA